MKKTNTMRIAALALAATMAFSLAGCKKDDPAATGSPDMPSGSVQPGADPSAAPDGYVDNSADVTKFRPEELIMADSESGTVIANLDNEVYYNGSGFQPMFAANALLTDDSKEADSKGLPLARFWDRIGGITFGDKTYGLTDIVRPRGEGFQVLELLAGDMGVDKYDMSTGELVGCLGTGLTGDALRESYSDRQEFEDYTVCVYYIHAEMSGLSDTEREAAAGKLQSEKGTDHDSVLDGTLAVMLYYDTAGYDTHYAVVASAPGYFKDADDYGKNMSSGVQHDITKCHMLVDDRPVGFLNHVVILCDQDAVPEGTVVFERDDADGTNGRIEDGDAGGTDGADAESDGEPAGAQD